VSCNVVMKYFKYLKIDFYIEIICLAIYQMFYVLKYLFVKDCKKWQFRNLLNSPAKYNLFIVHLLEYDLNTCSEKKVKCCLECLCFLAIILKIKLNLIIQSKMAKIVSLTKRSGKNFEKYIMCRL
jgi:hypothetical protein